MNRLKQRKLAARARRQESLRLRSVTPVEAPNVKDEKIEEPKNTTLRDGMPSKKGPGRPPKAVKLNNSGNDITELGSGQNA